MCIQNKKLKFTSLHRIGPHGLRDPPHPGDRQRSGLQTAPGRPEGEQAGLPGPGGQRPSLQGREEAVLQWEQAAGQLRLERRRLTQLAACKLCGAGARCGRPEQTDVAHASGQHRPAEEGETAESWFLLGSSFILSACHKYLEYRSIFR